LGGDREEVGRRTEGRGEGGKREKNDRGWYGEGLEGGWRGSVGRVDFQIITLYIMQQSPQTEGIEVIVGAVTC